MPTFTVIIPMRTEDGRDLEPGSRIELTQSQAKYLLLSGKIRAGAGLEPAPTTDTRKPKLTVAKPAAADTEKEK